MSVIVIMTIFITLTTNVAHGDVKHIVIIVSHMSKKEQVDIFI
jgi:hypothetical protein